MPSSVLSLRLSMDIQYTLVYFYNFIWVNWTQRALDIRTNYPYSLTDHRSTGTYHMLSKAETSILTFHVISVYWWPSLVSSIYPLLFLLRSWYLLGVSCFTWLFSMGHSLLTYKCILRFRLVVYLVIWNLWMVCRFSLTLFRSLNILLVFHGSCKILPLQIMW